jgi:hypothetical protein
MCISTVRVCKGATNGVGRGGGAGGKRDSWLRHMLRGTSTSVRKFKTEISILSVKFTLPTNGERREKIKNVVCWKFIMADKKVV